MSRERLPEPKKDLKPNHTLLGPYSTLSGFQEVSFITSFWREARLTQDRENLIQGPFVWTIYELITYNRHVGPMTEALPHFRERLEESIAKRVQAHISHLTYA